MPLPSVTVNVTETRPAGSDATAAPRMSLLRPAPAICVGAGVGTAVGVRVGAGFESLPPHPAGDRASDNQQSEEYPEATGRTRAFCAASFHSVHRSPARVVETVSTVRVARTSTRSQGDPPASSIEVVAVAPASVPGAAAGPLWLEATRYAAAAARCARLPARRPGLRADAPRRALALRDCDARCRAGGFDMRKKADQRCECTRSRGRAAARRCRRIRYGVCGRLSPSRARAPRRACCRWRNTRR